MKKLLYLIPLAIAVLNFFSFSLYKDKVDLAYNKNSSSTAKNHSSLLTTLSPAHWLSLDFSLDTTDGKDGEENSYLKYAHPSQDIANQEALYKNATFRGFPFGFYLDKHRSTKVDDVTTTVNATGLSWLWAGVNGLIILAALFLAIRLNRSHGTIFTEEDKVESIDPKADLDLGPVNQPTIGKVIAPHPDQSTNEPEPLPSPPAGLIEDDKAEGTETEPKS